MRNDSVDDDEIYEAEDIEAYCVRCRETVVIEDPIPVWTRKGVPAVRGECPLCGGPVFRMGKSAAHDALNRPAAVQVATNTRVRMPQETVYINFAPADTDIAERLADDLQKLGVACWLHETEPADVSWAGGVHPSLRECLRMVYVLSPDALGVESVETAWRFFKEKNKSVVIAQVGLADPPDPLRRRPRFDFTAEYKAAFRQLLQALTG
jgi:hypothetical protein